MKNKQKTEYIPYCYLIGWSELNVWYYGCEYGEKSKIANPRNLWVSYFTSSKYVKTFIKQHGNPDIIEIRKTFETKEQTIIWESKVLTRMNVIYKENWLNRTNNKAIINSPETQAKIGQKNSKYFTGRPKTKEHREKLSAARKGKIPNISKENRVKIVESSHTPETNTKRSTKMSSKIWITNGTENKRINKNEIIPESWRQGRTNERTVKQMNSIRELGRIQGKKNKGRLINGKNHAAKRVIFRGIEYYSIKNAAVSTNTSIYTVKKECIFL